jgi:GNAT superfamily N-acetyltransferase
MTQHKAQRNEDRLEVRPLRRADLDAIVEIDAIHSGAAKPVFWAATVERALRSSAGPSGAAGAGAVSGTVAFAAVMDGEVAGYVFAEARAWEFGSPLCGWITAIGVRPERSRQGVALALGGEVCHWLRSRGITSLRTMVRRDAVDVLSFFRAVGFRAGPYLEMELYL